MAYDIVSLLIITGMTLITKEIDSFYVGISVLIFSKLCEIYKELKIKNDGRF